MIKATNLSKSFGLQLIFDSVSFNLNRGEHAGLTGRNGHGKTTLYRLITGEEQPDSGEITIPKNYSIGYLKQELKFTESSAIDEGCTGLPEHHKDESWMVKKVLSGLGFTRDDMQKNPYDFSAGYQVRINLCRLLVSEPDLLLLDEPTNFLDIVSIRWLKNFLNQWKNEFILITHDRGFMDSVINSVIGIHRKNIKKIRGDTGKYYDQILKEEEIHEKTRVKDEKKKKDAELFIKRFRAKARLAGLVQSRIKALDKKEKLDKLEKIKSLDFRFTYRPFNAKTVMSVNELEFSYNKELLPLIKGLSFTVGKNDRICVIGKNGRGKSTLLRLLSGGLKPDNGEISLHPGTETGYYAQTNTAQLNPRLTVEEEIMDAGTDRQMARNISGALMFEGDSALKKISVLSGGEKCRVLIGRQLAAPSNLILLDEPTNHLDMESTEAFMAAVDEFEGAVIIVTHNQTFLHALATRFIIFQHNRVFMFEGSYQSFLEKIGWEEETYKDRAPSYSDAGKKLENLNRKDLRKIKADILTNRSKELKPLDKEITGIEKLIEELEEELKNLNSEMINVSGSGNGARISGLSKEIHQVKGSIEKSYRKFEDLTIKYDELKDIYDEKIRNLDR